MMSAIKMPVFLLTASMQVAARIALLDAQLVAAVLTGNFNQCDVSAADCAGGFVCVPNYPTETTEGTCMPPCDVADADPCPEDPALQCVDHFSGEDTHVCRYTCDLGNLEFCAHGLSCLQAESASNNNVPGTCEYIGAPQSTDCSAVTCPNGLECFDLGQDDQGQETSVCMIESCDAPASKNCTDPNKKCVMPDPLGDFRGDEGSCYERCDAAGQCQQAGHVCDGDEQVCLPSWSVCGGRCGQNTICEGGKCVSSCGDDKACCAPSSDCANVAIASCVCGFDSFCCDEHWDAQCVSEAQGECGLIC